MRLSLTLGLIALAWPVFGQDADLAKDYLQLQQRLLAAKAGIQAERADGARQDAEGGPMSLAMDPRCPAIRQAIAASMQDDGIAAPTGPKAEQAARLLEQVAFRLTSANGIVLPRFCGVMLTGEAEMTAHARELLQEGAGAAPTWKVLLVSRGLIEKAPDDSAMAAVMAHELAHFARHDNTLSLRTRQKGQAIWNRWFGTAYAETARRQIEGWYAADSDAQERAADLAGAAYLRRAGYDLLGMNRALMASLEEQFSWDLANRINALNAVLGPVWEIPPADGVAPQDLARLRQFLKN